MMLRRRVNITKNTIIAVKLHNVKDADIIGKIQNVLKPDYLIRIVKDVLHRARDLCKSLDELVADAKKKPIKQVSMLNKSLKMNYDRKL